MINVGMGAAVGGRVGKGTGFERVGMMKVGNIRADGDELGVMILYGVESAACDEAAAVDWTGDGDDWQAPSRPAKAIQHRRMYRIFACIAHLAQLLPL